MWKEFKEFALKGNIMDLAIGVVIGAAFQSIIKSLVDDIVMPAVSILTGKVDFSDMVFTVGEVSIRYGSFITAVVNFLIIAFSIFLVVRYLNKMNKKFEELKHAELAKMAGKVSNIPLLNSRKKKKKKEEPIPEPTTKVCEYCLSEINIHAKRCPHCTSVLEEIKQDVNVETVEEKQNLE